jgi:haloacetate dehalogenase
MLAADPENALFRNGVESFEPEALEEYKRFLRNPETIHATCEDYRAAATIDFAQDADDREAGKKIACPLLALWGGRGNLEEWYDVLDVWRGWAEDVRRRSLDSGHYIPEEAPEETLSELRAFFGA